MVAFSLLSSLGFFLFFFYFGKLVSSSPGEQTSGFLKKISGGHLGEQPAQWGSGMFTPDGKYYVYTYNIRNVNQYSSRGGSSFSSGTNTSYLQVMDCITGKTLLKKPVKTNELLTIMDVDNKYVWLDTYKISDRRAAALYQIGDEKLKFSGDDIVKLNPSIPLEKKESRLNFYENTTGKEGVVVEAIDGRQYLINPESRKLSLSELSRKGIDAKDEDNMQVESRLANYDVSGETRKKLVTKDKPAIISNEDFINPRLLVQKESDLKGKALPILHKDNLFVLSSNFTTNDKNYQLAMMDSKSLKTIWMIDLPQEEQEMNNYKKERFFLKDSRLLVANATNFLTIDLEKGAILGNIPLFGK